MVTVIKKRERKKYMKNREEDRKYEQKEWRYSMINKKIMEK